MSQPEVHPPSSKETCLFSWPLMGAKTQENWTYLNTHPTCPSRNGCFWAPWPGHPFPLGNEAWNCSQPLDQEAFRTGVANIVPMGTVTPLGSSPSIHKASEACAPLPPLLWSGECGYLSLPWEIHRGSGKSDVPSSFNSTCFSRHQFILLDMAFTQITWKSKTYVGREVLNSGVGLKITNMLPGLKKRLVGGP